MIKSPLPLNHGTGQLTRDSRHESWMQWPERDYHKLCILYHGTLLLDINQCTCALIAFCDISVICNPPNIFFPVANLLLYTTNIPATLIPLRSKRFYRYLPVISGCNLLLIASTPIVYSTFNNILSLPPTLPGEKK